VIIIRLAGFGTCAWGQEREFAKAAERPGMRGTSCLL
jgi:hypothetical protein